MQDLRAEYEAGWKVTEIMPVNVLGFQTHRDHFAVDFEKDALRNRIAEMRDDAFSDDDMRRPLRCPGQPRLAFVCGEETIAWHG